MYFKLYAKYFHCNLLCKIKWLIKNRRTLQKHFNFQDVLKFLLDVLPSTLYLKVAYWKSSNCDCSIVDCSLLLPI